VLLLVGEAEPVDIEHLDAVDVGHGDELEAERLTVSGDVAAHASYRVPQRS